LLQSEEKTIMSYEAQQNAFTDENKPSRSWYSILVIVFSSNNASEHKTIVFSQTKKCLG
jgi:hypothetical protein